jgi:hypothetical protein
MLLAVLLPYALLGLSLPLPVLGVKLVTWTYWASSTGGIQPCQRAHLAVQERARQPAQGVLGLRALRRRRLVLLGFGAHRRAARPAGRFGPAWGRGLGGGGGVRRCFFFIIFFFFFCSGGSGGVGGVQSVGRKAERGARTRED